MNVRKRSAESFKRTDSSTFDPFGTRRFRGRRMTPRGHVIYQGDGILRRLLAGIVAALTIIGTADAQTLTKRPPWMSKFAWAVGVCETGKGTRHPDFEHRAGPYGGFSGWYVGTWQTDAPAGFPRYPWLASARQQYRVFLISRSKHRYWGCIANGGYRAWM